MPVCKQQNSKSYGGILMTFSIPLYFKEMSTIGPGSTGVDPTWSVYPPSKWRRHHELLCHLKKLIKNWPQTAAPLWLEHGIGGWDGWKPLVEVSALRVLFYLFFFPANEKYGVHLSIVYNPPTSVGLRGSWFPTPAFTGQKMAAPPWTCQQSITGLPRDTEQTTMHAHAHSI